MSTALDTYRRNLHTALSRLVENTQEDFQNGVQFRRSVTGATYVPAVTCEEIALTAVEKSARIRALKDMQAVLDETYRRLFEKEDE